MNHQHPGDRLHSRGSLEAAATVNLHYDVSARTERQASTDAGDALDVAHD